MKQAGLPVEPTELPITVCIPLCLVGLFVLRGAFLREGVERFRSLLKAFVALSIYTSGVAYNFSVNPKMGALEGIVSTSAVSLRTLAGCLVTVLQSDNKVSIMVLLSCLALAYGYGSLVYLGIAIQDLSSWRQSSRLLILLSGFVSIFAVAKLLKLSEQFQYVSSISFVATCALGEFFISQVMYPRLGFFFMTWFAGLTSLMISYYFCDWSGRYWCLAGSVSAVSCLYPVNRMILVYLATAGFLYRGATGPKEEVYRNLWLCVSCSILLGFSILFNEGSQNDKMLPYVVISIFLFFTLLMSKWLTFQLKKKERFRVLLSGICFFPATALLALKVDQDTFTPGAVYSPSIAFHKTFHDSNDTILQLKDPRFFDWWTIIHLVSLPVLIFKGWAGSTISIFITQSFILGLNYGAAFTFLGILTWPAAVRLAAILTPWLTCFYNTDWTTRYHSMVMCVLIGEMFISPVSAVFLIPFFAAAHKFACPKIQEDISGKKIECDESETQTRATTAETGKSRGLQISTHISERQLSVSQVDLEISDRNFSSAISTGSKGSSTVSISRNLTIAKPVVVESSGRYHVLYTVANEIITVNSPTDSFNRLSSDPDEP